MSNDPNTVEFWGPKQCILRQMAFNSPLPTSRGQIASWLFNDLVEGEHMTAGDSLRELVKAGFLNIQQKQFATAGLADFYFVASGCEWVLKREYDFIGVSSDVLKVLGNDMKIDRQRSSFESVLYDAEKEKRIRAEVETLVSQGYLQERPHEKDFCRSADGVVLALQKTG